MLFSFNELANFSRDGLSFACNNSCKVNSINMAKELITTEKQYRTISSMQKSFGTQDGALEEKRRDKSKSQTWSCKIQNAKYV